MHAIVRYSDNPWSPGHASVPTKSSPRSAPAAVFAGETVSHVLASVLKSDPRSLPVAAGGLLPGGFELGELSRDLRTCLADLSFLHRLVDLLHQRTEVDAAALRRLVRRLALQIVQVEFLVKRFL